MPPAVIKLGERDFTIRPLPLRVVRDISASLRAPVAADPVEAERQAWDRMVSAIVAALSRDHPDMTADAILDCEGTLGDFNAAYAEVLRLSGIAPSGEAKPPEAGAASTGDGSTAA